MTLQHLTHKTNKSDFGCQLLQFQNWGASFSSEVFVVFQITQGHKESQDDGCSYYCNN